MLNYQRDPKFSFFKLKLKNDRRMLRNLDLICLKIFKIYYDKIFSEGGASMMKFMARKKKRGVIYEKAPYRNTEFYKNERR